MRELNGKTAVITGGASGIGRALAERFGREGMNLVLVDIESATLEETAHELANGGAVVTTRMVDVSDADQMDALANGVIGEFGSVELVCNNAGVAVGGSIWELTTEDWAFTLGPNLWGVIHGIRVFVPHMVERNIGHVVNTASMAGLVSTPLMGAYNTSKQGVVAMSETLYAELAERGSEVGVSVLCPGFVRSQIWDAERNRPEHLQNDESVDRSEAAVTKEFVRSLIEGRGMAAEVVADRVHDSVLANQFYILTSRGQPGHHGATFPLHSRRAKSRADGSGGVRVGERENGTALGQSLFS